MLRSFVIENWKSLYLSRKYFLFFTNIMAAFFEKHENPFDFVSNISFHYLARG